MFHFENEEKMESLIQKQRIPSTIAISGVTTQKEAESIKDIFDTQLQHAQEKWNATGHSMPVTPVLQIGMPIDAHLPGQEMGRFIDIQELVHISKQNEPGWRLVAYVKAPMQAGEEILLLQEMTQGRVAFQIDLYGSSDKVLEALQNERVSLQGRVDLGAVESPPEEVSGQQMQLETLNHFLGRGSYCKVIWLDLPRGLAKPLLALARKAEDLRRFSGDGETGVSGLSERDLYSLEAAAYLQGLSVKGGRNLRDTNGVLDGRKVEIFITQAFTLCLPTVSTKEVLESLKKTWLK